MRGETTRVGKRPLRSLTAIEKISAIRRVHEGESKASVARDLSVPESTLRGWCKSEHKIRGMARNSSTPDSNEAHSPLSTSGNNNNLSINTSLIGGNHSSEDEGTPSAKRQKIEQNIYQAANLFTNENLENETSRLIDSSSTSSAAKIDYASLVASMTGIAGLRPENNAFLLQQLGLLGGAGGALAKNLLNYQSVLPHTSTVGLVENGLQYTKSGSNNISSNNNKRHSTSAIAPAQLETMAKSYTRKSSPPAAEIPLTVDPASPRKTSDLLHHHHHQSNNIHNHHNNNNNNNISHNNNNNNNNNYQNHRETKRQNTQIPSLNNNKKVDEALWLWLTSQQQQLQGAGGFNPNQSQQDAAFRSWFWQWYKQLDSPLLSLPQQQQQINGKKSPTKTRALLDSVLYNNNNNNNNNNNDNVRKSMNGVFDVFNNDDHHNFVNDASGAMNMTIPPPQTAALPLTTTTPVVTATTSTSPTPVITSEEAIEHGEKFFKWLNKCSEPAVSRLQIMQFKYLLDNLKTCKKNIKPSHSKQRRK